MSVRTLTRMFLGLAVLLLLAGWFVGFSTINVPTGGSTTTASCGSPWSPRIGAIGPLADVAVTPEQCSAAVIPLGILAAVLSGCGFAGLIAVGVGRMIVDGVTGANASGAARVNLGPRRKPSNPNA